MTSDKKIRVGITHGDINGIGYEVILKTLADNELTDLCTPVVFGSGKAAGYYRKMLGLDEIRFHNIADASDAKEGCANLVNVTDRELTVEPGKATEESGNAAITALDMAVDALKEGSIDVLVTAPINKAAMQMAGFGFTGHTEYLESRLGDGTRATMTFVDGDLRVALLHTHQPLKDVADSVTQEALTARLREMDASLRRDFGKTRPLIAVLALNPHAGDGGLIGSEEKEVIKPAVEEVSREGVMACGPYPADGFFGSGSWRKFDAVLAMYHDQGLVAFKTLSGCEGVNYTAGLPYVRTSPDHGTGYDIAGKGTADASSLRHAIFTAIDIFRSRRAYDEARSNPLKHFSAEKGEKGERRRQPRQEHADKGAAQSRPKEKETVKPPSSDDGGVSTEETKETCITE